MLVAAEIGAGSWSDAIGDGTVYTVLTDTQFGHIFQLRLLLAAVLAGLLLVLAHRHHDGVKSLRMAAAATAAAMLGSLGN